MQALINPLQDNLVVQVEPNDQTFEIGLPLYWLDCPDYVESYQYQYIEDQFIKYTPPEATADENKTTATSLLSATDWTTIADVSNPAMSNPYLANQADFINYRNYVRQYAVYPEAGNITWPTLPTEQWTKV